MDFLVAENTLVNFHQPQHFINHGNGYSFSVPGILGSPPQLHCSSTYSSSSQHSNSSFPSSPIASAHLHPTILGHHVSPATNYLYPSNNSTPPSSMPLQSSSPSIYHGLQQQLPLLYTNTQNTDGTQFDLLNYLASAAADSALLPPPQELISTSVAPTSMDVNEYVAEFISDIPFGDVSTSAPEVVEIKKNCSRINVEHLRQFCKEEMQRNSTIPVSLEEKMYREGMAAVNKYATDVCKEYGLEVGALFGDDDLDGDVRHIRGRQSTPFRGFEAILASVSKMENKLGYDQRHKINRRDGKTLLQVICSYHCEPFNCKFFIEAVGLATEQKGYCASIKWCNPYHICLQPSKVDLSESLIKEEMDSNASLSTITATTFGRLRAVPLQRQLNASIALRNKKKISDKNFLKSPRPSS